MPAKPVFVRAAARTDAQAILDYYLQTAGQEVALKFVDALQAAYGHIGRHPGTGSPRYAAYLGIPGLRFWGLKKFPYLVFYIETQAAIDTLRVLHAAADLPEWLSE